MRVPAAPTVVAARVPPPPVRCPTQTRPCPAPAQPPPSLACPPAAARGGRLHLVCTQAGAGGKPKVTRRKRAGQGDAPRPAEPAAIQSSDDDMWKLHQELLQQIEERRRSQQDLLKDLGVDLPAPAAKPPAAAPPKPVAAAAAPPAPPPPAVRPPPPAVTPPVPAIKPRTLDFPTAAPPKPAPPPPVPQAAPQPVAQAPPPPAPEPVAPAAPKEPEKPHNPNAMNIIFVGAECAPWSKTGGCWPPLAGVRACREGACAAPAPLPVLC